MIPIALLLTGCMRTLLVETVPADASVDVPVAEPVQFRFRQAVDIDEAFVQWTRGGANNRVEAAMALSDDGTELTVTPLREVGWGILQWVRVHDLRDAEGDTLDPVEVAFRTKPNLLLTFFTNDAQGEPTGAGRVCEVDDRGRYTRCADYREGLGDDGEPGTDDDVPAAVETYTYDGPRIRSFLFEDADQLSRVENLYAPHRGGDELAHQIVRDAEDDGELGTPDDELREGYVASFDDNGFRIEEWRGVPQVNGLFDIRRSEIDMLTRLTVNELGDQLEMIMVSGPGKDERWGTSDDVEDQARIDEVDDRGAHLGWTIVSAGKDGRVFTKDDVLETVTTRMFDEEGRLVESEVTDADGNVLVRNTIEWSATGVQERFVWRDPDTDEVLRHRSVVVDEEGQRISAGLFRDPGDDETWFTEDDVPTWRRTFAR